MKLFRNIITFSIVLALTYSCVTDEDRFYSLDYLEAPGNVDAVFDITQDNTGLVTVVPNSEGASKYTIDFGDGTTKEVQRLDYAMHTYAEGVYQVAITAHGITGLTSSVTKELNVTFKAPENLEVVVVNDEAISNKVSITATADFATVFEIYFGETQDEEPTMALPDETISYTYAEPGDYEVFLRAKSAAIATLDTTFTVTAVEISSPVFAAPTPPARNDADVISLFSDAYTNINVSEWNPDWGQSTTLATIEVEGNSTLLYGALSYTGIVTDYGNPTDVTGMTHVHFDYWTNDAESLALKLVNTSLDPVQEDMESVDVTLGTWVSVDIPLEDYDMDLSGITQLLFESSGANVYIDNLYFYSATASAPVDAAPTPILNESSVISLFSDAYTNIALSELNPDWGQSTGLMAVEIQGNNAWMYTDLSFTGIVTDYGNATDVSGMTHVHFDYWTTDATSLALKLVNTTLDPAQEDIESLESITYGSWVSVDIPLADYDMDISGITQLLFESSGSTVYIDNLYFYNEAAATEPTSAAPMPEVDEANVISLFSDAYTNIALSELNPDWGQSTVLTNVSIQGNNTWLYEALNYTGIVTDYGNATDVSGMTYVHFDYWTADATSLGLKLVNTTLDPGQEDIETVGSVIQSTWVSVDIPLSDYDMDLSGVTQLLFESSGSTVYIDNLYFY